jgi:hypothetical protein
MDSRDRDILERAVHSISEGHDDEKCRRVQAGYRQGIPKGAAAMIRSLKFLVALGFLVEGLIVGIAEADIAMGPVQWFLAAIVVELLGDPPIGKGRRV